MKGIYYSGVPWVKNPDYSPGYGLNPITGCLGNCPYCYARKLAKGRAKTIYLANSILPGHDEPDHQAHHNDPFYPRFWPSRLEALTEAYSHSKKPRGVFVCDMSDLFGPWLPREWIEKVLNAIEYCRTWRFYLLTKQPRHAFGFFPLPANAWFGVTITQNRDIGLAYPWLEGTQNHISLRYASFEPLLQPLDRYSLRYFIPVLGWVIIGSQTNPTVHPAKDAVMDIIRTAREYKKPVFIKEPLASYMRLNYREMPE